MKNSEKPAYPLQHEGYPSHASALAMATDPLSGLTKREEFAKAALQGILSTMDANVAGYAPNEENVLYCVGLAIKAADELLKQLDK